MPEKPDLEDDMLTIEDDEVEFPKVAKVSEVPATKNSSNHDIQTTTKPALVAETIAKDSKEPPVKAVSEAITKVTSDRAAASPPCEVSSTTINNEIEKEKGGKFPVVTWPSRKITLFLFAVVAACCCCFLLFPLFC